MTLDLECWDDPLSSAQKNVYERVKEEYYQAEAKLRDLMDQHDGQEILRNTSFSICQLSGDVSTESFKKIYSKDNDQATEKQSNSTIPPKSIKKKRDEEEDEEDLPLMKRFGKVPEKQKQHSIKKESNKEKKPITQKTTRRDKTYVSPQQPSEIASIGGLAVEKNEEPSSKTPESSSEKAKVFPSLFVTPKPSLRDDKSTSNTSVERNALDSKVKVVLMLTSGKFTEWLIQQGLLRSEQKCALHQGNDLKLGVFSDGSKFPCSGGYVWISECCPTRFVSVFYGSLFEGATNPPSSILKLIYHWSCQSNIQNVVHWVKVSNVYIKLVYTWLRAICTLALYRHQKSLGGLGKHIEVGVISLGTTTSGGKNRAVKVELLGVLDPVEKKIRLRAVEPYAETSDRSYKGRFAKILQPLNDWVHKESTIVTDHTVDVQALKGIGYHNIIQTMPNEANQGHSNASIMHYLKRVVPKMFQNTLSLLPNQLVQHFLDELVWREEFGSTPLQAFDNITNHIAEQTRIEAKDTLIQRLFKVAKTPLKEWKEHIEQMGQMHSLANESCPVPTKRTARNVVTAKDTSYEPSQKSLKGHKKVDNCQKNIEGKERDIKLKTYTRVQETQSVIKNLNENGAVGLEEYYYGVLPSGGNEKYQVIGSFSGRCPECKAVFEKNVELQRHIFTHINLSNQAGSSQCVYCLEKCTDEENLQKHIDFSHPNVTKNTVASTFNCIICENRFNSILMLNSHMQKTHVPSELPYKCGCCNYRCSSHRHTIDHFYEAHGDIGVLQCPLCLLPFQVFTNGKVLVQSLNEYYNHLKKYTTKNQCKKCNKCCLSFLSKGSLKVHQIHDHESFMDNMKVKRLLESTVFVQAPKVKIQHTKEVGSYLLKEKLANLTFKDVEGNICIECDVGLEEENHLIGLLKCQKCRYHTYCLRAMMEHTSACQSGVNPESNVHIDLEKEMHCVCGFSSCDGNSLARHLALCEHKSSYPSVDAAQENTVKRSMLDMLGLVRRASESAE